MNLLTYAPELVNVTIIKIDEKPVAYSIDFINKNSTQGSQKAHIPVYNRYSPARFLIMALCERAKTNGESFFDFGRGIDDFKRSFITRSEETYGVFICQNIIRRNYLRNVFMIRNTVYDLLVQSKPLYRLYRWILKGVRHG